IAFLDVRMPRISGLEMAKLLKRINPNVNVIFVTGFDEFSVDAFSLRASGYLMKPVMVSDVKREIDNLRNPVVDGKRSRIEVQTFGKFEVFVNGKPIEFSRKPSKEALAYLVDLKGAVASAKDISSVIFEDSAYTRSMQSYMSIIMRQLGESLQKAGIAHILLKTSNGYAIDVNAVHCDAYDYLSGEPSAINKFFGEYMSQYSWSESSIEKFYS
ncbi:MAG: response regulator, partial [Clostridia bacterium]|nr:response regulator [Clostridia bacterium]